MSGIEPFIASIFAAAPTAAAGTTAAASTVGATTAASTAAAAAGTTAATAGGVGAATAGGLTTSGLLSTAATAASLGASASSLFSPGDKPKQVLPPTRDTAAEAAAARDQMLRRPGRAQSLFTSASERAAAPTLGARQLLGG